MENNLENKEKFFALYYGQKVAQWATDVRPKDPLYNSNRVFSTMHEDWFLQLKSLDSITSEDISLIFKIDGEKNIETIVNVLMGNLKNYNTFKLSHFIDDIRKNGYAWPWMELTVKDLIDYGWVRLSTV